MNNGKQEGEERRYVGESLAERMRGGPESDADKQSISGSIWSTKSFSLEGDDGLWDSRQDYRSLNPLKLTYPRPQRSPQTSSDKMMLSRCRIPTYLCGCPKSKHIQVDHHLEPGFALRYAGPAQSLNSTSAWLRAGCDVSPKPPRTGLHHSPRARLGKSGCAAK